MTSRVRILACGAIDRGDDGAGILAVRALPDSARQLAQIEEVGQLSAELLMDDPAGMRRLVVDCVSGLGLGTIVDLPLADLPELELPARTTSSHALSPGAAVVLATLVGAVREEDRFLGIGGDRFEPGANLSPAVAEGLDQLVAALARHVEGVR